MELTKYSRNRLLDTLAHWHVPRDYADPIYNYLVHGFDPGGFFTSVFANNFVGAMGRSHPANTVEALKTVAGWIVNHCPHAAWGNYANVENWIRMDPATRRTYLEDCGLIFTEQEEIVMALKNQRSQEPMLY